MPKTNVMPINFAGQLIEDTDSFCSVFSVDCIQMFRDLPVNFPADIDRLLLPSKRPFLWKHCEEFKVNS